MHCLIVDDEELARTLLENYVTKLPQLQLVGKCKHPLEAMQYLQTQKVDLLLLDIQMPELSGLDFLKILPQKPLVILTTAYPEYALDGYALDVIDYLLKPIRFERFAQAVNKAAELFRLRSLEVELGEARESSATIPSVLDSATDPEYLLVKADHKIHRLRLDDIRYIQSMREYVAYVTHSGRILALNSLKNLETELPASRFLRVHKSFMVSLDKIDALEGNMLRIGSDTIPIGANYRDELLRVFSAGK
ncbi:MAG: response regulator transcription factor [Lewinellaceae bacterium]|nr:response regulator transcription factor [Lewinellaceae bacterium]